MASYKAKTRKNKYENFILINYLWVIYELILDKLILLLLMRVNLLYFQSIIALVASFLCYIFLSVI